MMLKGSKIAKLPIAVKDRIFILKITLNPDRPHYTHERDAKRRWNLIKGDIEMILDTATENVDIKVGRLPDYQFIISHIPSNQQFFINYDFLFAKELNFAVVPSQMAILVILAAIVIRLAKSYKNTFKMSCSSYSVIEQAAALVESQLRESKVTRNWMMTFIDFPMPGRRPINEAPLTPAEVRQTMIRKKRAEGKCSISTWLDQSTKDELDAFCKNQGLNLEQALNQLIPVGIKTTCSVLQNFSTSQK